METELGGIERRGPRTMEGRQPPEAENARKLISSSLPGGGHSNPLQYSCLENPTVRGVWGGGGYSLWGRRELDTTEAANTGVRENTALPTLLILAQGDPR